ncbi:hypothetical protein D3C72_2213120 [compost metagenome]
MAGWVRLMIQEMTSSSRMRKISASARPIWRARSACSLGRRDTSTEMKTMLSIPSTISITVRVPKAIQALGSANSSSIVGSIASLAADPS